jgi:hypothetical protein
MGLNLEGGRGRGMGDVLWGGGEGRGSRSESILVNLLRSQEIDSQPGGPELQLPEPVFVDLLRSPGIDSQTGKVY